MPIGYKWDMQTKREGSEFEEKKKRRNKINQSLSKKSQSIAISCSGALREQPNSLLRDSLCVLSGLDV